jgi:hypothetical protein
MFGQLLWNTIIYTTLNFKILRTLRTQATHWNKKKISVCYINGKPLCHLSNSIFNIQVKLLMSKHFTNLSFTMAIFPSIRFNEAFDRNLTFHIQIVKSFQQFNAETTSWFFS